MKTSFGSIGGAIVLLFAGTVEAAELKFDFVSEKPEPGFLRVAPQAAYDATRGFGFRSAATSNTPAIFAVAVEEGNYDVSIRFGDPARATLSCIKSESRRLMLEKIETGPGQFVTQSFTVNVRMPAIRTGGTTKISGRELGPPPVPDWDDQLTFEFNGRHPGIISMEITPARDAVTVFIAGDSTVTDQAREPFAGWGQMLPRFFGPGVAVANHAWSGLSLSSFEGQKRLDKILSAMRQGDYLLVQFGHNDQKDKRAGAGPFTTYKANLHRYIAAARSKGGIPVLVTPMERRRFDETGKAFATLGEYAEAVRQVGVEEKVPVIDLNVMSLKLYAALGPVGSKKAFVHYPANTFPGRTEPLSDDSHHNAYGAYELARCVVEGLRTGVPVLARRLREGVGSYDPARPDEPEQVDIPLTPWTGSVETPAGN